jgi:hypothetical protein
MADADELVAGTDPASGSSTFLVEALTLNSPLTVYFDSVTGRIYNLYVTTNLLAESWEQLGTNEPGSGGLLSITDTNESGAGPRLYRLGVKLAP